MTVFWSRVRTILRFKPHDTSTEQGRSHERYRRMAFTTMASLAARAISLLTSLLTVPLTFRYLGAERYGLWMVVLSLISAMGFADLGIGNGVMNVISEAHGKDDHDLAREYVSSGFMLMLCIAAVLAVAGGIAFPSIPWLRLFNVKSELIAKEGSRALLVLYCWFLVNIPLGLVMRVQAGLQQGYWPQIVSSIGNIFSLAALLLVIKLNGNLVWLVLASTFSGILVTALNCWLLFRRHPWVVPSIRAFRAGAARKIFKLGLLFFVLQIAVSLGYASDNIVITQVMGAAAVAVYAVPQKLFGFVSQLLSMGTMPLWPAYGEAIARGDMAWVRRVFWGSLRVTLAITIPACAVLVLWGPWALRVLVGKSLHAPTSLLVVLAVWGVIGALSTQMAMLLNGASIMKPQTITAVFASVINLALSIFLTRRFGVMGVCLGSIVTQLLIAYPMYFIVIRGLFRRVDISQAAERRQAAGVS